MKKPCVYCKKLHETDSTGMSICKECKKEKKTCKVFTEDCYNHPTCLATLEDKVKCKKCGKELKIGGGGNSPTYYFYCECGVKQKDKGKKQLSYPRKFYATR